MWFWQNSFKNAKNFVIEIILSTSKARLQGVSENKFDHLLSMIRQLGMVKQTKDEGVILFERNAGLWDGSSRWMMFASF